MTSNVLPNAISSPCRNDAVVAVAVLVIFFVHMVIATMAAATAGRGVSGDRWGLGGRQLLHTLPASLAKGGIAHIGNVACLVTTVPIALHTIHSATLAANQAIRAQADERDTAALPRSGVEVQERCQLLTAKGPAQRLTRGGLAARLANPFDHYSRQSVHADLRLDSKAEVHPVGDDGEANILRSAGPPDTRRTPIAVLLDARRGGANVANIA